VGEIEKQKKLAEYDDKNRELFRDGKSAERVALWREAKKEFPNNLSVLHDLMYALQAEDRKANADEIIEYGKRILEESTDNDLRGGAIQSLCFTYYYAKGDAETAIKYARMADDYAVCVNEMMPRFLEGDEAVKYCQSNIQYLLDMIRTNADIMCWKGKYKPENKIKAYKFVLDCFNLLYPDKNCGFYHVRYSEIYEKMAHCYLELGNTEEMFSCLENSVEEAIKFDSPQKDGYFTSFMLNKLELSHIDAVKDHTENQSGLLLKKLLGDKFAHFGGDMRMKKIIERLRPIAKM